MIRYMGGSRITPFRAWRPKLVSNIALQYLSLLYLVSQPDHGHRHLFKPAMRVMHSNFMEPPFAVVERSG